MTSLAEQMSPEVQAAGNALTAHLVPQFKGLSEAGRHKRARRLITAAFARYSQRRDVPPLGCGTGKPCHGCCLHQIEIDTSEYEVERVLDLVESEGRLEEIVARAEKVSAAGGGACPLLSKKGRCTVYKVRPLSCVAYHSLDREACHQGAKARIPHHQALFMEASIIAGFGLVSVDELMTQGKRPLKVRLFKGLAEKGRKRLDARKDAA